MAPLCPVPTSIARRQMGPFDWQSYQEEPHGLGKDSFTCERKVLGREKQNKSTDSLFLVSIAAKVKSKQELPPCLKNTIYILMSRFPFWVIMDSINLMSYFPHGLLPFGPLLFSLVSAI